MGGGPLLERSLQFRAAPGLPVGVSVDAGGDGQRLFGHLLTEHSLAHRQIDRRRKQALTDQKGRDRELLDDQQRGDRQNRKAIAARKYANERRCPDLAPSSTVSSILNRNHPVQGDVWPDCPP